MVPTALATYGNGKSAVVSNENGNSALVTHGNGKSALVTNENGKQAPVTDGTGNLVEVIAAANQVEQQPADHFEQKSGWMSKTLSFRPYVQLSSTGRVANGVCTPRGAVEPLHQPHGKEANGAHVESGLQHEVARCPLAAKSTQRLVETYKLCNPDFKGWSDLTAPSNRPEGRSVQRSGLDYEENGVATVGAPIPSEGVSNNGRDEAANAPAIGELTNTRVSSPPKVYLTKPSEGVSNEGRDNVEDDLILRVDDVLINSKSNVRYVVKGLLGKGSFGQVCKCWTSDPTNRRDHVAIKIIKNRDNFHNLAQSEATICKFLTKIDLHDRGNIVQFREGFEFAGHSCLVFELLGIDLHKLSTLNGCAGFSIQVVRRLTIQLLQALTVLEAARIMHCDLKPENIVLHPVPLEEFTGTILAVLEARRNAGEIRPDLTEKEIILHPVFLERFAKVKLIDFGLASKMNNYCAAGPNTYIQSRYYRSPEVVLKLRAYTPAMDMWSLGCVAAEFFLGIPLFPAANEYDLFRFMIDILGCQPPDEIIFLAEDEVRARFFKLECAATSPDGMPSNATVCPTYKLLSEADIEARARAYGLGKPKATTRYFGRKTLGDIIMAKKPGDKTMTPAEMTEEILSRAAFSDFLMGVLHFDFRKRWNPKQALQHPFLTGEPYLGPFTPTP